MYYYDGVIKSKFISDTRLRDLKKLQLDSRGEAIRHIVTSIFEPHSDRNVAISEKIVRDKLIKKLRKK
jgi:hypothetical protein